MLTQKEQIEQVIADGRAILARLPERDENIQLTQDTIALLEQIGAPADLLKLNREHITQLQRLRQFEEETATRQIAEMEALLAERA